MIEKEYAEAILNILMAKPIDSKNADENGNDPALVKRAELKEDEVIMYVAPTSTKLEESAQESKKKIDSSGYWETQDITVSSDDGKTYIGYKTVRKDITTNKMYPINRYLALLTKMPESDGSDFEEFRIIHEIKDGETIYCNRIDLNTGYFSNDLIMKAAEMNKAKITNDANSDIIGGAITLNDVVIYFPEITENNWGGADDAGPKLEGFGIFANATPVEGEKPYLWGKLNNEDPAIAQLAHVPLFRKEKFQFSIK